MELTSNESLVLKAIGYTLRMYAGEIVANYEIWSDVISDHCKIKGLALSGVISSLAKKGLVICNDSKKASDATLVLTDIGLNYIK